MCHTNTQRHRHPFREYFREFCFVYFVYPVYFGFWLILFYYGNVSQHLYSGKAADIWALGATVYALVFGNVPYLATNVPAVYEKIQKDSLQFPPKCSISAELKDLIEQMLEKDPAKRITLPKIKVKWKIRILNILLTLI